MLTIQHPLLPVPSGALLIPDISGPEQQKGSIKIDTAPPVHFSLVVPTYNESGNIEKAVQLLSRILDEALPGNYELIVVDDDSPDRTWEDAQALMADYPQLRVMRRQHERGLSTAVIRGWQAAQGEILGVIDGDLQHPPQTLLQLLAAIDSGADLAVASRHVDGGGVSTWSATRRFLSRGAQLLGLIILPRVVSRVSDPMSGYFMVRRTAIAERSLSPVGYKILIEVLGRGAIGEITEVGYVFNERETGESKVTWRQYIDYLSHLFKLRVSSGRIGRLRRKLNFPLGRFLRFGLVGLSGLIVDMSALYLLFDILQVGLTRSAILAAELAIINNFFWNDIWTFGDIANQQRQWKMVIKRFLKFNIICIMGLILKILLLNLFFNSFQLNPYLANLVAIAIVTFWNFLDQSKTQLARNSSKVDTMTERKRALITGITGQDGSYLSEFLLEKNYEVHGIIRRTSTFNTDRIDHIYEDPHEERAKLFLHYGDLTDGTTLRRILEEVQPTEIYNLGAQSHVRVSFDAPQYTVDAVGMGTLRLLEAIREYQQRTGIQVRFYQAGSSEMFGKVQEIPQSETTPFYPRSPYACAKVYAHWQTVNYRESYDLFASNGILFNHESPRRGETFVTRKITRAVARIVAGQQKTLYMGNLDAKRDWGYAKDYVRAMWMMLQQEQPDDFVVATGETHSVREFLDLAFGYVKLNWQDYVEFDERYLRPAEVELLIGDPTKARQTLGWTPSVTFEELVFLMVEADLKALGLIPLNGSVSQNGREQATIRQRLGMV